MSGKKETRSNITDQEKDKSGSLLLHVRGVCRHLIK